MVGVDDGSISYYNNSNLIEHENIFSMENYRQVFTKGWKFEKSEDRMTAVFNAYGRLMRSSITILNASHKTSVTFIQMVLTQALHEGKKFDFGHIAL